MTISETARAEATRAGVRGPSRSPPVTIFRRAPNGPWQPANTDKAFDENEIVLVAAWRRLKEEKCRQST